MHKHYYIVTLILVFIATILSDKYLPTFEPLTLKPAKEEKQTVSDFFLEDVTSSVMHANGQPEYSMTAKHVTHYPDHDVAQLDSVEFKLFQEKQSDWSARAQQGKIENRTGVIHLRGNVVLQRPQTKTDAAVTLKTSELHIYTKKDYAETPAAIEVISGKSYINATGMRLYINEGRMEFLSDAKAKYEAHDS